MLFRIEYMLIHTFDKEVITSVSVSIDYKDAHV